MKLRTLATPATIVLMAILLPGILLAADVDTGNDKDGTDDPPPKPDGDSNVDTGWNPTITCDNQTSLSELLTCMLGTYWDGPEEPDFQTWLLDDGRHGIRVMRLNEDPSPPFEQYVEVEQIEIKENDSGIARTQVRIDQDGLMARFAEVSETPEGSGSLFLELDDDTVEGEPGDNTVWAQEFKFADYPNLLQFNDAVIDWLRDQGFIVIWNPPFVDVVASNGFRRLRYYSSDDNVVSSHIALLPFFDPVFYPLP